MDQLFCMRIFVRIVEQGSCTRAADDLGVARSTITTALSRLEKHLGVRLLHRTTRRMSLTDEGRSWYENCVRILGEIAEAEDTLSSAKVSPRGRLRISIAQSFEALGFLPLLARFMQRYPDLSIEVIVTDRAVNMVEEGIDCAVRAMDASRDAQLVTRTLFIARWLTCASPAYLARHGTPAAISDLAKHDCIRFVSPYTGRTREWLFDERGAQTKRTPHGKLALTSLDAVVAAARTGLGIAQVPDVLAYHPVMDGELRPLLTEHIVPAPTVVLAYPGNRYLPAKVRALAGFLQEAYPREGWWPKIAAHIQDRPAA